MKSKIVSLTCFVLALSPAAYVLAVENGISKTPAPIVIDGVKDGVWVTAPTYPIANAVAGAGSNTGCSGSWQALWDSTNLYVFVDVNDETLNRDSSGNWNDDSVEVFVDIHNDKATSYVAGADDYQYRFNWERDKPGSVGADHGDVTGIDFRVVTTANGYAVEAAMPWTLLFQDKGGPSIGDFMGFEVQINDDDNGGDRDNQLDWFSTGNNAWSNPSTIGTVTLAPGNAPIAVDPKPADKATDVSREAVLSWTPGPFAGKHDVYFGTVFDDVNAASRSDAKGVSAGQGQDATTFDPPGLLTYGQTYYWRVDEVNATPDASIYKGEVWSFTAEPYGYPVKPVKATASSSMSSSMGPDKTIDGSGMDGAGLGHGTSATTMWMSKKGSGPVWVQYEFGNVYKLYQMWVWNSNQAVEAVVGFGVKDVKVETSTDGTTWTAVPNVSQFAQAPGEEGYEHNTTVDFGGVQAKFVKLTIDNNWADSTKQASLSEVRFFYVPVKAFGPTPATGSTGVTVNAMLSWRPGRQAVKHQVYVGSDSEAVAKGTVSATTVTGPSLSLASMALEYGRTYYWKVNEVNDAATPSTWEGDVWSFVVIDYAVVDDFETCDDVCNRVFFNWVDGFGHTGSADCQVAPSAGNGTGSTVGNMSAPFAERRIVHGGKQSMPMTYDNSKSPFYSEAQREWPTNQAWTGGGVNTLVVSLRGDAPGFVETSPGNILMNGMGTDVWDASDQFRFAYKVLKGNGTIVAKVENVGTSHEWAKAGVMIRETISSGSKHAFVAATPTASHGVSFQRRVDADTATNLSTDVANTSLPQWVKLTRSGDAFTAQYSSNGVTWTDVAVSPAVSISMASDVLIGLAVSSHAANVICGAEFSNVSTTGGVSGQWQVADVGVPQLAGNTPETFYIAVQDSAGKVAVVSNPDATLIATGDWQKWSIPLSQLTSSGVNVGSIKKMIVGVGNRNAPKAGGIGKICIDDIQLTRTQ